MNLPFTKSETKNRSCETFTLKKDIAYSSPRSLRSIPLKKKKKTTFIIRKTDSFSFISHYFRIVPLMLIKQCTYCNKIPSYHARYNPPMYVSIESNHRKISNIPARSFVKNINQEFKFKSVIAERNAASNHEEFERFFFFFPSYTSSREIGRSSV